jgi:hypothetical protein
MGPLILPTPLTQGQCKVREIARSRIKKKSKYFFILPCDLTITKWDHWESSPGHLRLQRSALPLSYGPIIS